MAKKSTNNELLVAIVDLYQKHEDDFCSTNQLAIIGQGDFSDGMDELMPKICAVIGHQELISDQCGKPEHDYCPRCCKRCEDFTDG